MEKLEILVLSCDKYSDAWDDFFNLKEKFWPDCPYQWHVVTESKDYVRNKVDTIKCGNDLNWAGRLRKALHQIESPYVGLFLEDYFIKAPIDNEKIAGFVEMMEREQVTFLNLGDVFHYRLRQKNLERFSEHLVVIPQHLKYGIDTSAAIWDKAFLISKLVGGGTARGSLKSTVATRRHQQKGLVASSFATRNCLSM